MYDGLPKKIKSLAGKVESCDSMYYGPKGSPVAGPVDSRGL